MALVCCAFFFFLEVLRDSVLDADLVQLLPTCLDVFALGDGEKQRQIAYRTFLSFCGNFTESNCFPTCPTLSTFLSISQSGSPISTVYSAAQECACLYRQNYYSQSTETNSPTAQFFASGFINPGLFSLCRPQILFSVIPMSRSGRGTGTIDGRGGK